MLRLPPICAASPHSAAVSMMSRRIVSAVTEFCLTSFVPGSIIALMAVCNSDIIPLGKALLFVDFVNDILEIQIKSIKIPFDIGIAWPIFVSDKL